MKSERQSVRVGLKRDFNYQKRFCNSILGSQGRRDEEKKKDEEPSWSGISN